MRHKLMYMCGVCIHFRESLLRFQAIVRALLATFRLFAVILLRNPLRAVRFCY